MSLARVHVSSEELPEISEAIPWISESVFLYSVSLDSKIAVGIARVIAILLRELIKQHSCQFA